MDSHLPDFTYLLGLTAEDQGKSEFASRRPEYSIALEASKGQTVPDGYRALLEYLNSDQETISPTELVKEGHETATRNTLSMMERRARKSSSAVSNSEIEAAVNVNLEGMSLLPHWYRWKICEELCRVVTNPSSMGEARAAEDKVSSVRRIFNNHQIQTKTIQLKTSAALVARRKAPWHGHGQGRRTVRYHDVCYLYLWSAVLHVTRWKSRRNIGPSAASSHCLSVLIPMIFLSFLPTCVHNHHSHRSTCFAITI